MSIGLPLHVLTHGNPTGQLGSVDLASAAFALVTLLLYGLGAARLRRSEAGRRHLPWWRLLAAGVGVVGGLAAVSSPAEHVAAELFFAHMVQHLVLGFVVAPALVLGRPLLVASVLLGHRAAPVTRPLRRAAVRWGRGPMAFAILGPLHLSPWILWHVPPAYDLALRSDAVHALEHLTLVISGAALTWLALRSVSLVRGLSTMATGMAVMSLLAAVLTFAAVPMFAHEGAYGISALEDQQVGGALMWFPGSVAYLVAAAVLVLGRLDRSASTSSRQAG